MNLNAALPLENASWPALLVNPDGVILRTNPVAIEIFGAYEGRNVEKIWPRNGVSFADFASLKSGTKAELVRKDKKSENFLISVLTVASVDEPNFLIQFLALEATSAQTPAVPLSPAVPAIDATLAHRQKLDCAMQLARSVSLDFNNALTSIIGYTSLLLSKADASHPWRNTLAEIEAAASEAAEIANDLANFSRQDEVASRRAGNLNEVIKQTVDAFRNTGEERGIVFNLDLERRLFSAKVDEAKIQQAFAKLLENAVQAIVGGPGEVTIRSRNCELEEALEDRTIRLGPGTYVCIEVTDTGCGISANDLPRVFEPFFTTKGSNHRGLGLAWVYGIVTNHGGGVAFSTPSETGGTTVEVYLPASRRVIVEKTGNTDEMGGVETVLMVDDEDLLLKMTQAVLSSFGYRVLTANSGTKALQVLSNEPVDLVITDLVMPNMGGRELIERIRLISPDVKIISSSGYLRPQNLAENLYLQKPFTTQELLQKVKEALSTGTST